MRRNACRGAARLANTRGRRNARLGRQLKDARRLAMLQRGESSRPPCPCARQSVAHRSASVVGQSVKGRRPDGREINYVEEVPFLQRHPQATIRGGRCRCGGTEDGAGTCDDARRLQRLRSEKMKKKDAARRRAEEQNRDKPPKIQQAKGAEQSRNTRGPS